MKIKLTLSARVTLAALSMMGFTAGSALAAQDNNPHILCIMADDVGLMMS